MHPVVKATIGSMEIKNLEGTLEHMRTVKFQNSMCVRAVCYGTLKFSYTAQGPNRRYRTYSKDHDATRVYANWAGASSLVYALRAFCQLVAHFYFRPKYKAQCQRFSTDENGFRRLGNWFNRIYNKQSGSGFPNLHLR